MLLTPRAQPLLKEVPSCLVFDVSLIQRIIFRVTERTFLLAKVVVEQIGCYFLKPNSITLAGSEQAPNQFGASSELVRSR